MVVEMPVLDNALLGCAIAFTPLMVALTFGEPVMRLVARGARLIPTGAGPLLADVGLDTDPPGPRAERRRPARAVLRPHRAAQGAAPRRSRRRRWSSATSATRSTPSATPTRWSPSCPTRTLVQANSILELRLRPERLTGEIGDFLDTLLDGPAPRRCVAHAPRRLGFRVAAWHIEPKRRNAGARSAWPRRRRPAEAAARKRTLQIGGGAVLGLAVIAVVAIVALAGGGDSKGDSTANATRSSPPTPRPPAAPSRSSSPRAATTRPARSPTRPTRRRRATTTRRRPQDGFYRAGNTPPKENFVHTLEHGRIEFQYKPGTPAADVAKLRRLAEEPLNGTAGYHVLLFENNTKMPEQFAATAWTKSIACPTLSTPALARHARVPQGVHRQGPRAHPVGPSAARSARRACASVR